MTRKGFAIGLLGLLMAAGSSVSLEARTRLAPRGTAATRISLDQIAIGLERPVYLTHAGDGSGRLFIVEKEGRIRISTGGQPSATPFLNLESRVEDSGNEQGLLSVAFHPDYASNGRFFVYYTARSTSDTEDGDIVVAEYSVSGNPNVANTNERILLTVSHSQFENHNGGLLKFGLDGYLYIGIGDGGSADDPNGNGQNRGSLLGKILRIDVNAGSGVDYGIPQDNPFVGQATARPEIYAYGVRNPWRYSFDRETGELWCGDVGQNQWEEIDVIEKGGNYGWNTMEAFHCRPPATSCDQTGLLLPVFEYSHDGSNGVPASCSITGGYVYRGTQVPSLAGSYVFADYCVGSGQIFVLRPGATRAEVLQTGGPFEPVTSFGEDEDGELYVITDSVFGGQGHVLKIVVSDGVCDVGCPDDLVVEDADGNGSEVVNFDPPRSAGPCGDVTCTPASGSTFDAGVTTVSCSSATGGGDCSFTVTVGNPDVLSVTGVAPPSARRKASLTVTVTGTAFQAGASVSFGTKIAVNAVRVLSSNTIEADIKVKKKAKRGARDVSVTNTGGPSATCSGCFTVQ